VQIWVFLLTALLPTIGPAEYSSSGVRSQTAELASYALSDGLNNSGSGGHNPFGSSPPRDLFVVDNQGITIDRLSRRDSDGSLAKAISSHGSQLPVAIKEVSEPVSPERLSIGPRSPHGHTSRPGTSTLTELIRKSPPSSSGGEESRSDSNSGGSDQEDTSPSEGMTVNGAKSSPRRATSTKRKSDSETVNERTSLLTRRNLSDQQQKLSNDADVEGQRDVETGLSIKIHKAVTWPKEHGASLARTLVNPKSWDYKTIWKEGVTKPTAYVPAVILGTLLNILDALSYGMCILLT
jgi:sulfate permease, SulP family